MEERLIADFFTEEKDHWWHTAKRSLVKQFIKGTSLDILVAGVGGGMICEELRSSGNRVTGMDISPVACEYVRKEMGVPVVDGDLERGLPFAKGSFDLVIIADVLEHLQNDKRLLTEAFRCLKPKGTVIVTVPAYPHMWSMWDMRLHHKRRYSLGVIKEDVAGSGFRVNRASHYHMLPYPFVYIYRIILRLPKEGSSGKSDFAVMSGRITCAFLKLYYCMERSLLKVIDLPFGLSIFVIGTKNG